MCENYCLLKKDKCYFVIFPRSVANMRKHINLYPNICEIIKFRAALQVLRWIMVKIANDVYFGEMFTWAVWRWWCQFKRSSRWIFLLFQAKSFKASLFKTSNYFSPEQSKREPVTEEERQKLAQTSTIVWKLNLSAGVEKTWETETCCKKTKKQTSNLYQRTGKDR